MKYSLPLSSLSSGNSLIPPDGSISYWRVIEEYFENKSKKNFQTIANKFSYPLTFVGFFVNFWLNASDILWAGSVLNIKTVSRTLANSEAKLQLKI
jgi:hypothetical protein